MSGGSFNYLCHKEAGELVDYQGEVDAEQMVGALAGLGYAADAAKETAAVLAEVRAARARIEAKLDRMRPVWQAMEWWRSGDRTEAQFKRDLAEYRGIALPDCKRCAARAEEPNVDRPYGCRNPDCANGKDTETLR